MATNIESRPLFLIRLVHTIVWAFFAGCIFAIPVFVALRKVGTAAVFVGIVLVEVLVLVINRWRCPLTDVAAKYTPDRRDNFDIFLPEWLARHNKLIFGLLYVAGVALTIVAWARQAG